MESYRNKIVVHSTLGEGTIIAQHGEKITVDFEQDTEVFFLNEALSEGTLAFKDPKDMENYLAEHSDGAHPGTGAEAETIPEDVSAGVPESAPNEAASPDSDRMETAAEDVPESMPESEEGAGPNPVPPEMPQEADTDAPAEDVPPSRQKMLKIALGAVAAVIVIVFVILFATKTLCIHKWQDATCTEPITCARCGRTQGEALGHNWQDATCTDPVTCANCGETKGEALGHTWVDATCKDPKTCSVCGETEGEALGHDWQDATCRLPKTCARCKIVEGQPLGHDFAEATCTEPEICSRCGLTEGDALGHDPDKWVTVTEATCSEEGKETAKCKRCGEKLEETIPMLEHTPGEWTVTTKATYGEAGEKTQYCTVCGAVLGTEEYELSAAEKESYFKALCKGYSYDTIARDPDSYVGKYAYFKGEVIQVLEDGDDVTLRVNVTNEGYYWDDTIMISYTRKDGESKILEDDIVTFYGILLGDYTYTSIFGASITVPLMVAAYITFN